MDHFKVRIANIISEVSNQQVSELCEMWVELFGHENEASLEKQLRDHLTLFLNHIIDENANTKRKFLKAIAGK